MSMFLKPINILFKYTFILVIIIIILFPFYWMVLSSFTPNNLLFNLPPHFIPQNPTISNYINVFKNQQYLIYFKNSMIVASGTVIVCLVVSILAGYSFSRFCFKGKAVALTAILTVQMFPIVVILISLYTFYFKWQLINTYRGLILADMTFCLPLTITLLKAFMDTIPKSIDESAKIDGCGRLRTLYSVILPSLLPGIIAVGTYTFLYAWDDFLFSLTILQKEGMKTVTVGLAQSFLGEMNMDYAGMMTFAVSATVPIVLLFIFFQKYMIEGLTCGAVKG